MSTELTQEQKDARWQLMTKIASLHNKGESDQVMTLLGENLDKLDAHVLSMVSNTITLTREFVSKHHALLSQIVKLDHGKQDIRDAFRSVLLEDLLEETNPVETR